MDIIEAAKSQLKTFFPNDEIEVIDERGDGRHFLIRITSEKFEGISRLERGRMAHKALDGFIQKGLMHAVRLELKTPNND